MVRKREFWRWALPVAMSLAFLFKYFKIVADHPNEQVFQSVLQALWLLVAVVFLRLIIAMFTWHSFTAFIMKIVFIVALLYPLYFLTAATAYVSYRG